MPLGNMKIGIDARMYRSSVAGIGRYSQNLIKNLLELDHENEYVLFMTKIDAEEYYSKNPKAKIRNSKIVIIEIPHYSIAEQTKLGKIIEKENLDLMHFLNFNHPVNYKGKFVATIHDLTLLFYPDTAKKTSFLKKSAFKYVMKKTCQDAEKIIVDAENTKKDILKVFKINPEKIKVIYLAADDKIFAEVNKDNIEKIKQQYAISTFRHATPVLLYVGQFRPHKNIPSLISAFNILRKEMDCKLVILGKPDPKHQRFFDLLNESEYKKDIILPGFVSNEELASWYKIADLFVFPSLYEGFGLPGLEAMAAGTPVVASNTSSLPEVYQNAAIYFDPLKPEDIAGKIKEILGDDKLRQELISKGKLLLRNYSWQKTAIETLKVYEAVYKEVLK